MIGGLLGRAVGFGYCTCRACTKPDPRVDRRRAKRCEQRQWRREQQQ